MDLFAKLFRLKAPTLGEVNELIIDDITFVTCSFQPGEPESAGSISGGAPPDVDPAFALENIWGCSEDMESSPHDSVPAEGKEAAEAPSGAPRDLSVITLIFVVDHTASTDWSIKIPGGATTKSEEASARAAVKLSWKSHMSRAVSRAALGSCAKHLCCALALEEKRVGYVTAQARIIGAARDAARSSARLPSETPAAVVSSSGEGAASDAAKHDTASTPTSSVTTEADVSQLVISQSLLARELAAALNQLARSMEAHILINGWLPVALCAAHSMQSAQSIFSTTSESSAKARGTGDEASSRAGQPRPVMLSGKPLSKRLRPYMSLMLLDEAHETLDSLPDGATAQLRALVLAASPLRSLQQLQLITGIDELQMLRLIEHLVAWGRATLVHVVTRHSRFVTVRGAIAADGAPIRAEVGKAGPWREPMDPMRGEDTSQEAWILVPGIARGSSHSIDFEQRFADILEDTISLATVMQVLGTPQTLYEIASRVPESTQAHLVDMLIWLWRRGLVQRVWESLMLLPCSDVELTVIERLLETAKIFRVTSPEQTGSILLSTDVVRRAVREEVSQVLLTPGCPAGDAVLASGDTLRQTLGAACTLLISKAVEGSPGGVLGDVVLLEGQEALPVQSAKREVLVRRRTQLMACLARSAPFLDGQHDLDDIMWRAQLSRSDLSLLVASLPDILVMMQC
jgi:hypothetical protein